MDNPARIAGAWLHYRKLGTDTYRKLELDVDGDGYLRATIAAGEVEAPGIEYFVEVVTDQRVVGAAIGSALEPLAVAVDAPGTAVLFKEKRNRSRVSLSTAVLDFGGLDTRDGAPVDRMFVFEADFLYRLRANWLYGLRVGLGVIDGQGGFADPLGPGVQPPELAFNYGYVELELGGEHTPATVLARVIAGVGKDGLGFGLEGKLRLGPEDGTNLSFGASTLADIGFLSELELQWMALPRFPLGLGIAVGNQPNPDGDFGVRFSADVGVQLVEWVTPTLTLSYQGRSIDHSGMGAGFGLVFDW
jgi:hypothetical protein